MLTRPQKPQPRTAPASATRNKIAQNVCRKPSASSARKVWAKAVGIGWLSMTKRSSHSRKISTEEAVPPLLENFRGWTSEVSLRGRFSPRSVQRHLAPDAGQVPGTFVIAPQTRQVEHYAVDSGDLRLAVPVRNCRFHVRFVLSSFGPVYGSCWLPETHVG